MTTSKPSEIKIARIIGDQRFLSRGLGVSRFILDANIRFEFDPAGIVLRLFLHPNRAIYRAQLKLIALANSKFLE